MINLDEFNRLVGSTIWACQQVEHDIKMIYAGMLKGDFIENINSIKNKQLGYALKNLKNLDNSDNQPYFSQEDYELLDEIKNIRNWLVHTSYIEFIYDRDQKFNENYKRAYNKLLSFNNRIKNLANQVEDIRIDIMKRYGRA